jgi:hypothetical protein
MDEAIFLELQAFLVKLNIIYQDNTSTMKLERNGMEKKVLEKELDISTSSIFT